MGVCLRQMGGDDMTHKKTECRYVVVLLPRYSAEEVVSGIERQNHELHYHTTHGAACAAAARTTPFIRSWWAVAVWDRKKQEYTYYQPGGDR